MAMPTMLPSPSPSETESTDDSTHLLLRRPAVAVHARLLPDSTAPGIALSCGAEHEADPATDDWWDARRPAVVPSLPRQPEQPQDRTAPQRPPRRSTGCGARVHPRAHAARDGEHWVGYVDGRERTVIIKLDGQYFRKRSALGLGGSGCGCCSIRRGSPDIDEIPAPAATPSVRCTSHAACTGPAKDRRTTSFSPARSRHQ
ncbi:hypothetical protein C8J57DRAFT_1679834 [Mycena rebaudengoi]|nr:hypothetical protein C8J57DRAFT_1679834 [Mycena rebaudengoi]